VQNDLNFNGIYFQNLATENPWKNLLFIGINFFQKISCHLAQVFAHGKNEPLSN